VQQVSTLHTTSATASSGAVPTDLIPGFFDSSAYAGTIAESEFVATVGTTAFPSPTAWTSALDAAPLSLAWTLYDDGVVVTSSYMMSFASATIDYVAAATEATT